MKKTLLFCCILTVILSCKQQSKQDAMPSSSAEKRVDLKEDIAANQQFSPEKEEANVPNDLSKTPNEIAKDKTVPPSVLEPKISTRKIIRTADMRFKVAKTENATYKIEQIAKKFGGFVTSTQMNSNVISQREVAISNDSVMQITQYELENNMTLRIPNSQLDTVLTEISRIYQFLDHRRLNADDITLAHLSNQLKAKIRTQAAQRIQNAIENKGKRLDDITNAETSATQLQDGAIEQQISQMEKDYNVDFSVINLNIYQDSDMLKTTKASPSLYAYGPSFLTRLKESVSYGWAMVLEILLVLVSIWYLFVLGFLIWILYKKYGFILKMPSKSVKA